MLTRTLIGALAVLLPCAAFADDRKGGDDSGPPVYFAAGGMVFVERSLYLGGEDRVTLLPLVIAQLGPVYIRGPSLGLYVYARERLTVATGISLDLRDTDRGDSPPLADMAELDRAVLGELKASFDGDWGDVSFSLAADISGAHDGWIARLAWRNSHTVGRFEVEPRVGIEWQGAKVNRYYYGVGAAEVTATRPLYRPDGGLAFDLGVTLAYPFAERHTLRLEAAMEFVSDEVSDSPIVARDSVGRISAGYVFRF